MMPITVPYSEVCTHDRGLRSFPNFILFPKSIQFSDLCPNCVLFSVLSSELSYFSEGPFEIYEC